MKSLKTTIEKQISPDIFQRRWAYYGMIAIIIIVLSILFFEIGFQKRVPNASDTNQWRWQSQQIKEFNKTHKETALWTDNMFSGMPSYLISFPNKFPFFDTLLASLTKIINWRLIYLIFGALGMYVFLIHKKFSPLIALFSALSFALSCHFIGLIDIGHNTKFRAIMYIPWIFFFFDDLRKNSRLVSTGFLSIFLISQLRENHFQISYYTFILMFLYWLSFLIKDCFIRRKIDNFILFTLFSFVSILITILAVANPYLSIYEYQNFTSRGIGGLSAAYATGWSFGVSEIISFLIPGFYGGISPYYWGPMGGTQTFMYMGIFILFLAVIGVIYCRKNFVVLVLATIFIICLMMSFGKYFPLLSSLNLSYLPLYNKFRVPAMILSINQFIVPVLAAYGLNFSISKIKLNDVKFNKMLLFSLFISLSLLIVSYVAIDLFTSKMTFIKAGEPEYFNAINRPEVLSSWIKIRSEILSKSAIQSFCFLFGGIVLLLVMVKGFLKKNVALLLIITLCVLDLMFVNKNYLKKEDLVPEKSVLEVFHMSDTDKFLLEDKDLYRIFPFIEFQNSRWAYLHQTIGGYHGAKLNRYNEILDKYLPAELIVGIGINYNVVNMLNVKYFIFDQKLDIPHFEHVYTEFISRDKQYNVYKNKNFLPRAWFVQQDTLVTQIIKMSSLLNNPEFDPRSTAIIEKQIPKYSFNENDKILMLDRDIHKTKWRTNTSNNALMVISEIYYPAGWNFYINGELTEHFPVNYILRGIVVPPGENIIEMKFEPKSYKASILLSGIGLLLSIILTGIGVYFYITKNYGKGLVYNIKI